MLKYCDTTNLKKYFGDFGGNDDISDFEIGRLNPDIEGIRKTIESIEFEENFRRILPLVCEEFSVKSVKLDDGRSILTAPALAKRYAMAARLAHAKCIGKAGVAFGSYDRKLVRAIASACSNCGLKLQLTLGKELASDSAFVSELAAGGAEVDDKTCAQLFDHPYAYIEVPFISDPEYYLVEIEANYGVWPKPALTAIFAGLYGADLLDKLGGTPEACVVPITTGTEALGVFKALKDTGCLLASCETAVAQEYHIIDTGAYTISTRSADEDKPPLSLCPELVEMWRKNQVYRLGCDRIHEIDASAFAAIGLSAVASRAAALAFETMDCKELLVLEV